MKTINYIPRNIYFERISPFIGTEMIKVIVGQRRVGKSFLLCQLMDEIGNLFPKADLLYINKELYEFDAIKNHADLADYVKAKRRNKKEKCFLFIDEIQDIAEFERALRSFFAEGNYDIYCTGSNANLLSGELASYLSGRYVEFKVFGLCYAEFLQFHKLTDSEDSFAKYYRFGGLPYLKNLPLNDSFVNEYLRNIYNTIMLKDIVSRYNLRNTRNLMDLSVYLADVTGHLFSANSISNYLKSQRLLLQPKTILEYLDYLTNAFLLQRVKPADLSGKELLKVGEKYYFEDLGIRHAIRPFRADDIGQVLENLVCHQLSVSGYSLNTGRNGNREIDFVATKDGEKHYIQVTVTMTEEKTRQREFGNLLEIRDNYPKTVITLDNIEGASYSGIRQMPIRKFLLEYGISKKVYIDFRHLPPPPSQQIV